MVGALWFLGAVLVVAGGLVLWIELQDRGRPPRGGA